MGSTTCLLAEMLVRRSFWTMSIAGSTSRPWDASWARPAGVALPTASWRTTFTCLLKRRDRTLGPACDFSTGAMPKSTMRGTTASGTSSKAASARAGWLPTRSYGRPPCTSRGTQSRPVCVREPRTGRGAVIPQCSGASDPPHWTPLASSPFWTRAEAMAGRNTSRRSRGVRPLECGRLKGSDPYWRWSPPRIATPVATTPSPRRASGRKVEEVTHALAAGEIADLETFGQRPA